MNVTFQGEIVTTGNTLITCTTDSLIINLIVINNITSNYVLTVNKLSSGSSTCASSGILLYNFNLDLGDTVRDIEQYPLSRGESIQLISDVPGTTYYITTIQS